MPPDVYDCAVCKTIRLWKMYTARYAWSRWTGQIWQLYCATPAPSRCAFQGAPSICRPMQSDRSLLATYGAYIRPDRGSTHSSVIRSCSPDCRSACTATSGYARTTAPKLAVPTAELYTTRSAYGSSNSTPSSTPHLSCCALSTRKMRVIFLADLPHMPCSVHAPLAAVIVEHLSGRLFLDLAWDLFPAVDGFYLRPRSSCVGSAAFSPHDFFASSCLFGICRSSCTSELLGC